MMVPLKQLTKPQGTVITVMPFEFVRCISHSCTKKTTFWNLFLWLQAAIKGAEHFIQRALRLSKPDWWEMHRSGTCVHSQRLLTFALMCCVIVVQPERKFNTRAGKTKTMRAGCGILMFTVWQLNGEWQALNAWPNSCPDLFLAPRFTTRNNLAGRGWKHATRAWVHVNYLDTVGFSKVVI